MSMTENFRRFETLKGGFIGGLTQQFARYKTYRRTLDELEALTDRELADLGVSRLTLRSIAYKAAYDG